MKNTILIVLASLLIFGCTKKSDPELALKDFIDYRFKSSQSRDKILSMVTGPIKEEIETMDEDKAKQFFSTQSLRKKRLTINIKNCEGLKCFITYTLKYSQRSKDGSNHELEVKKIAEIWQEEDQWLIAKVNNVKTYIESQKPMGVESEK